MGSNKTLSFTALDGVLPIKMLAHDDMIHNAVNNDTITPVHIRVNITNRCNLSCPWCCRKDVDRKIEMPYEQVIDVMERYKELGCKAVTISGGGEPLLHPQINEIIEATSHMGIQIGLLTNGWLLKSVKDDNFNKMTWIRISLGDGQKPHDVSYWSSVYRAVKYGTEVDLGFSYVVTDNPNMELIHTMIEFANNHGFMHVRMVSDINTSSDLVDSMCNVQGRIHEKGLDDDLVIYQTRTDWTRGKKRCLIGLIRPIIDTDGYVYACCATGEPDRDYAHKMSVGTTDDIESIFEGQECVDGSVCKRCFMDHYNRFVGMLLASDDYEQAFGGISKMLLSNVKHEAFI